ncbi:MCP four helix bundle domain-containing protein [Methylobacterium sp. WSM2598]|uniref:MCP four helix bundle domain-containing protein n=1 Tax=Methylobacterium sp. WSM2598 TaxID=398261 RepID=UPI000377C17D|nr:MCP four helix bundle domain-containing protein [Methylobacterium sp. WSM2598]
MTALSSIKARLVGTLLLLSSLVSVAAGYLSLSWSTASTRTIYQDRVVCLGQIASIRDGYDRITAILREIRESALAPRTGLERVAGMQAEINSAWSAYRATYLAPEEKLIASEVETRMRENASLLRGIGQAAETDSAGLRQMVQHALDTMVRPTHAALEKLTAFQIQETGQEFARSEQTAGRSKALLIACLAAAMLAIGFGLYTVVSGVVQAAQGTQLVTASIAGVRDAASETGAASAPVLASAGALARQSDRLGVEVATYLRNVQAA